MFIELTVLTCNKSLWTKTKINFGVAMEKKCRVESLEKMLCADLDSFDREMLSEYLRIEKAKKQESESYDKLYQGPPL